MSKVNELIFEKDLAGHREVVPFSIFPKDLQDDDLILIRSNEGHYSDNNSWDPFTEIKVFRPRERTVEEIADLKAHIEKLKVEGKEQRRLQYIKLKEEFDDYS